jgi:hypothetical protein
MKKLTLLLTAVSLAAGASMVQAQPASAVSSYSPPVQKHVKKPKKAKKGASAPMAAPAAAASQ